MTDGQFAWKSVIIGCDRIAFLLISEFHFRVLSLVVCFIPRSYFRYNYYFNIFLDVSQQRFSMLFYGARYCYLDREDVEVGYEPKSKKGVLHRIFVQGHLLYLF